MCVFSYFICNFYAHLLNAVNWCQLFPPSQPVWFWAQMDRWWWSALDMECCISSTHRVDWYQYIFFSHCVSFNNSYWHRLSCNINILGFWFEDKYTSVISCILTVEMNNNHYINLKSTKHCYSPIEHLIATKIDYGDCLAEECLTILEERCQNSLT